MMNYLFTSESVSEGHPDKVADQISDAILDEFLRRDPSSRVACEAFCSTGMVVVMGEVRSEAYVDIQTTVREVINRIGYDKADYMFDGNSCGVLSALHEQSPDIGRGVAREGDPMDQGAGDQGMMFGYACRETAEYMPLALSLSHLTLRTLADIRKLTSLMPYLRPDAKAQYTIEYDGQTHRPLRVHTVVISTQHDPFDTDEAMHARIEADVRNILLPRVKAALPAETAALFGADFILHVNPTGKFVIGGPHGDTGLTGRKIIVDTYGGKGAHGGGAFSGKDHSKVDRSGAYAARHIAKNLVAAGVADEVLVQISYAIGIARPVSIFVNTYGTAIKAPAGLEAFADASGRLSDGYIAEKVGELFDLRPAAIIRRFGLTKPIYSPTAAYGHMGREPYEAEVTMFLDGRETRETVRFFAWEALDAAPALRKAFGL